jgi:hypothetical protein
MKKIFAAFMFVVLFIGIAIAGKPSLLLDKDIVKLYSVGDITALHFELVVENADSLTAKMLISGYQLACNAKGEKFSCIIYSMELTPFIEGNVDLVKINGLNLQSEIIWTKTEGSDVNHKTVFLEGVIKME